MNWKYLAMPKPEPYIEDMTQKQLIISSEPGELRLVSGIEWHTSEEDLPKDPEETVGIVVSADLCGCNLIRAYQMGGYDNEGQYWWIEGFPEAEHIRVHAWFRMPELPEMIEGQVNAEAKQWMEQRGLHYWGAVEKELKRKKEGQA